MDQSRRQFLAETEDLIQQVFAALDELHEQRNRQRQRELIDELFRRIHRIKGSAASFGFEGLSEIAHEFENLLDALRAERVPVSDSVLDTCENAATALSESLTLATSGVIEPSRRDLFESLRTLAPVSEAGGFSGEGLAAVLSNLPAELSQALTDEEKRRIARRYMEGNCLCVVATSFDVASFDEQFYSLKEKLAERGEVISTSPAIDPEQPEKINFRILFSSSDTLRDVKCDLIGFPDLSVTELTPAANLVERQPAPETKPALGANAPASKFIRTDLDDLDRLISSTHELFRLTTGALALTRSMLVKADRETEFEQLAREIRRSFLGVENELIGLRMVSLGPILQRAARAGRVAARLSNKQVDFEIVGSHLRLDKLLCDAIADPLLHLVRNAVDHGIETSETRVKSGKPQRGKVTIEAVSEGSRTRVRVTDDGGGVDPETVSRAATELGIFDQRNKLDMNWSLRMIFRPGFSTLSAASTLSGRGVGLDIVEAEIEQVGGEVRVSSEPGRRSIFEIRLPVTFSLLDSTIVSAGENRYCLDTRHIVKAEQIAASEIEPDGSGESLRSKLRALPLVSLREMLGQSGSRNANAELSVITCELPEKASLETAQLFEAEKGKRLIGVVVDGVAGTEEVLVRNLGRYAGRWYGVAGATELRDGTTALVLDLPRLVAGSKQLSPE